MVCRVLFDFLLKLLNLVLGILGLGMIGYGVYLLVEWIKLSSDSNSASVPPALLLFVSNDILKELEKAWFIYAFIGIGVLLLIMSCFGCIGAATRNGCCLSFYSFLIILLIVAELAVVAFIFLDHNWKDVIPADKTGNFEMIYNFLRKHWKIAKWVALGAVVLEALAFMLALAVRLANQPLDEDEDDEEYLIGRQRDGARQPLIGNRQNSQPPSAVPTLEPRPIRNDAWSQRMRNKYGIDVLNFSYNQSENATEQRGRCTIL
ncbi:Tobamovirus multiplication protein 2A [Rhynchospora pubera]|uniref:Tobamovirus multiplication protein 2A n=1 Tax=Rhynchospora pubera TaxID=906938 RepID=A0AAV8GPF1_9POAL|nr:Tobamovirus multiplication protein 2A [Rhynchospora pubera]